MPQRNIYVRDEDEEVFEKAKSLFEGKSLSETVIEALKGYVKDKESGEERKYGKFKREIIPVGRMPREDTPDRWIEFTGRLIATHQEDKDVKDPEVKYVQYAIYQGVMGGFLLTCKSVYPPPEDVQERWEAEYVVGKSVEELKMKSDQKGWEVPVELLNEAKEELGGRIVENPLMELEMGR